MHSSDVVFGVVDRFVSKTLIPQIRRDRLLTQAGRTISIESALPPDTLLLEDFEYEEGISQCFLLSGTLLAQDPGADLDGLLRTAIRVNLEVEPGRSRSFHAYLRSVELQKTEQGMPRYRFEAVPMLWFLTLNRDCRIYQGQTVPEIVTDVLRRYSGLAVEWRLVHTYPTREYCVQYRESDFQFVTRLLEDEGIFYFFQQSGDGHVMVIGDFRSSFRPSLDQPLPYFEYEKEVGVEDAIFEVNHRAVVQTRHFALNDYNFLAPSRTMLAAAGNEAGPEQFDYPGNYSDPKDGGRYARLRLEETEAMRDQFTGKSCSRKLQSGFHFQLVEHPVRRLNRQYTLIRLKHTAMNQRYWANQDGTMAEFVYRNEWVSIPSDVTYRPQRLTPRPKVEGPQTAVVVGTKMDHPFTETHGRVKVHFFWDRYGHRDGNDSCWVRVSQPWAGRNWGSVSIPRVGQEVIVDFLEGDPDRPIITGRVYNEEMRAPYALPEGAVHMGMKSRSIGGGGYNEISVNDTNTGEGITIHAEKDMSTVVENNETVHVKNCRTETVDVDETITINNNRTETVAVDETIEIGNNRSEKVGVNEDIKIGTNRTTKIGSNDTLTVGSSRTQTVSINEMINIGAAQQLSVGGLRLVNVGLAQMITVGLKHMVNAGYEITLNSPTIVLTATKELTLQCGGGTITIDAGGNITINGTTVKINC